MKGYFSHFCLRPPEWTSWCWSNICWNLCWTLKARMVLRPWREDERWEKTGLRAKKKCICTPHLLVFEPIYFYKSLFSSRTPATPFQTECEFNSIPRTSLKVKYMLYCMICSFIAYFYVLMNAHILPSIHWVLESRFRERWPNNR